MADRFVFTVETIMQKPRNLKEVENLINQSLGSKKLGIEFKITPIQSELRKVKQGIREVTQEAAAATDGLTRFGENIGKYFTRFTAFTLAATGVFTLVRNVRDATTAAIEFDRTLNKISQVLNTSKNNLGGLTNQIFDLSTSLGVSSKSLSEIAITLAQAGFSAKDTEVALKGLAQAQLAPTFEDDKQTLDGLIAAVQQFNLDIKDSAKILGVLNEVAAQTAVESSDLVQVIQRAGGVFVTSGGKLEELLALFTAVRATTRAAPETIATGLRTIFARLQRPRTQKFLESLGITGLRDEITNEFVGPFKAFQQISQQVQKFSPKSLEFSAVVEQLGGVRQLQNVIPLLTHFAVAEDALNIALSGTESLSKDAAIAQDALAIQLQKTREEFNKLINSIVQEKEFRDFISVILSLTRALIQLAETAANLAPLFAVIGGISTLKVGLGIRRQIFQDFKVQNRASGGLIPGVGNTDSIPALLTPGEFVINKKSAQKIGLTALTRMNKFADGGLVGFNDGGSVLSSLIASGYISKSGAEELMKKVVREEIRKEKKSLPLSGQKVKGRGRASHSLTSFQGVIDPTTLGQLIREESQFKHLSQFDFSAGEVVGGISAPFTRLGGLLSPAVEKELIKEELKNSRPPPQVSPRVQPLIGSTMLGEGMFAKIAGPSIKEPRTSRGLTLPLFDFHNVPGMNVQPVGSITEGQRLGPRSFLDTRGITGSEATFKFEKEKQTALSKLTKQYYKEIIASDKNLSQRQAYSIAKGKATQEILEEVLLTQKNNKNIRHDSPFSTSRRFQIQHFDENQRLRLSAGLGAALFASNLPIVRDTFNQNQAGAGTLGFAQGGLSGGLLAASMTGNIPIIALAALAGATYGAIKGLNDFTDKVQNEAISKALNDVAEAITTSDLVGALKTLEAQSFLRTETLIRRAETTGRFSNAFSSLVEAGAATIFNKQIEGQTESDVEAAANVFRGGGFANPLNIPARFLGRAGLLAVTKEEEAKKLAIQEPALQKLPVLQSEFNEKIKSGDIAGLNILIPTLAKTMSQAKDATENNITVIAKELKSKVRLSQITKQLIQQYDIQIGKTDAAIFSLQKLERTTAGIRPLRTTSSSSSEFVNRFEGLSAPGSAAFARDVSSLNIPNSIKSRLMEFNKFSNVLPDILKSGIQHTSLLEHNIPKELEGTERDEFIQSNFRGVFKNLLQKSGLSQDFSDEITKTLPLSFEEFKNQATNATKFAKDLTEPQQKVVEQLINNAKEQTKIQEILLQNRESFVGLINARAEARLNVGQAQANTARLRQSFFGGPIRAGVDDFMIRRSVFDRVGTDNVGMLGRRLSMLNDTFRRQEAMGGADPRLVVEINRTREALAKLGDTSGRLSDIMDRLNQIEASRAAKISVAERFVTGSPAEKRELIRNMGLARAFVASGRDFSTLDDRTRSGVITGLRMFGAGTIPGTRRSGDEIADRILGRFSGVDSSPEGRERDRLRRRATEVSREGEDVAKILASEIGKEMKVFGLNVARFAEAAASIPHSIAMNVNHRIEVIHNGAQVFASLQPAFTQIAVQVTNQAINRFIKEKMPDVGQLASADHFISDGGSATNISFLG